MHHHPMLSRMQRATLGTLTLALLGTLAACNRHEAADDRTAGQKLDAAMASARQEGREARAEAGQQMDRAGERLREATADARAAGSEAANRAAEAVDDATLTARVNAALAKDSQLSALKIDVDTQDGHVALRGQAPNREARDHATQLASAIKGVRSVDNQLVVDAQRG